MVSKSVIAISVIAIIVVAAIVGVGIATNWFAPTPVTPTKPKVLSVALSAAPPSLDPVSWTGVQLQEVAWVMYDRLVEVDTHMNIVPGLATSWNVSSDGLTWTFYLRKDVVFSDGTACDASAIAYNFNRILTTKPAAAYRLYMNITQVTVINSTVIQFTTNAPWAPLLANLAYVVGSIASPTSLAAHPGNYSYYASGTGPYMLKTYIPGSEIELVPNPYYWGPKPGLDQLNFLIVADDNTRAISLETGACQVVDSLPLPQYFMIKNEANVTTQLLYERPCEYMLDCALYSKTVRQALNYAINKTAITQSLFSGTAVIDKSPIPPLTLYATNNCTPYEYNPTLAKQLLTQAGYPNGLNITLETTNGAYPYDTAVAQVLLSELGAIGVKASIVYNSVAQQSARIKSLPATYPQASQVCWGTSTGDPDYILGTFFNGAVLPPITDNPYYYNATVVNLIRQGEITTNPAQRAVIYAKVQQMIWQDAPDIWLYIIPESFEWTNNVHGVQVMPTGAINLGNATID